MQNSKRDIDVKNRLLDSVGEGKGGMIWQNRIETCIKLRSWVNLTQMTIVSTTAGKNPLKEME